jgi:hypothetical protein
MVAFPYTPDQAEQVYQQETKPVEYRISDFNTGFKEENLPTMAVNYLLNHQDFPADENYNPKQDPQLQNYEDFYHHFAFSKSAAESTYILNKLNKQAETNYKSPWYHLGRITGAFLDPSSLLLFTKAGQTAKIFGSALVAEETMKQSIDPVRSDEYVPWIVAGGYGLPYVINKMAKGNVNAATHQKIINADKTFHSPPKAITQPIYEDGKFINPNQTKELSSVGAAATEPKKIITPAEEFTGEQFVKSNLGIFGEDGPWTNVFRTTKSSSKTARTMIADILDTPLLKLKNTKEYGFQATNPSIEVELKMREVGSIEAMQEIKNQYLKYIARTQKSFPKTEIGVNLHNRFNNNMSLAEFSREVTKSRLSGMQHEIAEVAEGARISQNKVYGPIGKEMQEMGIRKLPIERELNFWKATLDTMQKKGETTKSFTSKVDGQTSQFSASEIANKIKKLEERLKSADGLIKDYVNIIYNKNSIDKNKSKFKDIIRKDLITRGKYINEKKLNTLVDDLASHFPFVRFEKTKYTDNIDDLIYERYAFNRPRYARATRARELNLLPQTQKELLDNDFIVGDIFSLMKTYYRQVTPDILFTKKYGDPNGLGYKYIDEAQSMTFPGLYQVAQEYNKKLNNVKVVAPKNLTGKAKYNWEQKALKEKKAKIVKERNQVLEDLEASIELVRGTYGLPADPHHWTSRAMRTMKNYNALTMLTGFFAAAADVPRIVMTSGIQRGFKTQFEMWADMLSNKNFGIFKAGKKEAQSFAEAVDMVTGQRAMLFSDIGDMFGMTNKIEGMMSKAANFNFMYVNLMSRWTEFMKSAASVTIGSRIIEDSIKWSKGTLADKFKTKLAASGIDEEIARRIAKEANIHSEKTLYNYMANTAEWTDDIAKQRFGAALNKDINITIVTPGKGDTPLFMNEELWSTIVQFKKFAMASTQRMLLRGMQEKDMDFLFGSILLMGSGMLIDSVYNEFRFGKDYSKLSLTQKLLNAFDRSGLGGIFVDVNRSIEALTDNRIGIAPMLGEGKPYGSSMKSKVGLLGPSAGQIYNVFDIMYDVTGSKYNHYTARNVRRLIPFQNVWYLDWLFDDIEKGLR